MIAFRDTYSTRKKEIEDFLILIKFLEDKENSQENGMSEFNMFFNNGENKISISYQEVINILKSNIALMLYNLIEFTVTNLLNSIYDEISSKNFSYVNVNECIELLWQNAILKSARDVNASFNTFLKKNTEIIENIINKTTLRISTKDTLPSGNLDGETIVKIFDLHGININTSSENYRPDILKKIKDYRNKLAHGEISFVEAIREDSILDIEQNKEFIVQFLEELIQLVDEYIQSEGYSIP